MSHKREFPKLDKKCVKIFSTLGVKGEFRFKDLAKILDMKEPTLALHLNHLINTKLVLQTVLSHKNVVYRINIKKLQELPNFLKNIEIFNKQRKNAEKLLNEPIDIQLGHVLSILTWLGLDAFKLRVLRAKSKWAKRLMYDLMIDVCENSSFRVLEMLMVDKCVKDDEYRKKVFNEINVLLEKLGFEVWKEP